MKKKTVFLTQLICSADLCYLTEISTSSVADKVADQYKSTQQNVLSNVSVKDGFAFVAAPHVEVAELVTLLGDAEREECLCLVLLSGYMSTRCILVRPLPPSVHRVG